VAQTRIKELTDKNQLQAQQDLVPNLNQQIATLRDQIGQMEAASTQAKKAAADAIAAAQAKHEAAEAASKKTLDLQTENQKLQQSLQANQETISTLQKQLEAAKTQPPTASTSAAAPADKPAAVTAPDADKDGVADATDLCPGSPAGSAVNLLGCPAQKGIVLEGVQFKSGTAALTPASQKILDQTATALKQAAQVAFEVAGYTDNIGDATLNQTLSNQRAQAVVSYLAGKGVAPARMSAKGYGADKPIADNATAEGRQKNRRIELHPAEN
jgi:outer membrane protein OmpA-like peptidoglycan-associated protein